MNACFHYDAGYWQSQSSTNQWQHCDWDYGHSSGAGHPPPTLPAVPPPTSSASTWWQDSNTQIWIWVAVSIAVVFTFARCCYRCFKYLIPNDLSHDENDGEAGTGARHPGQTTSGHTTMGPASIGASPFRHPPLSTRLLPPSPQPPAYDTSGQVLQRYDSSPPTYEEAVKNLKLCDV